MAFLNLPCYCLSLLPPSTPPHTGSCSTPFASSSGVRPRGGQEHRCRCRRRGQGVASHLKRENVRRRCRHGGCRANLVLGLLVLGVVPVQCVWLRGDAHIGNAIIVEALLGSLAEKLGNGIRSLLTHTQTTPLNLSMPADRAQDKRLY